MIPQPGELFRLEGHPRMRWRCLEVTEHHVTAYGGSMNPWGKQGTRSFRISLPFVVVEEKADA